jgi:hypothetical protein
MVGKVGVVEGEVSGRKGGLSICCRRRQQQQQRVHVTRDSDSEAANDGEYAK